MNNTKKVRLVYETNSPAETFEIAKELTDKLAPGTILCMKGDLGVGKTVFAQGLAAGLGIDEPICSPTFTIVQVYEEGRMPFYHFDVYRIADPWEMDEIGYEDYFFGDGICLVEWAELIEELIPEDASHITIEKDLAKGLDYRKITYEGALEA